MEYGEEREFYVRLHNICSLNQELRGFKLIKASSGEELLDKACNYFRINVRFKPQLQIWSANSIYHRNATRIDTLQTIPREFEFVWLYAFPLNPPISFDIK
jgi:hypothetical protein